MNAESLLQVLRDPAAWEGLSLVELERALRQAGRAHLMASLGRRLDAAGLRRSLPAPLADRFGAADVVAAEHERRLRFALRLSRQVTADCGCPVVVLKGGAYLLGGFANAAGRLTSDLDLLVPESHLAEVEQRFLRAGWLSQPGDDYDERYYRDWMHELPPLVHPHHGITVDLHHNLTPRTGRLRIDARQLFDQAVPLDADYLRLGDEDLVLHLCLHLFHDGEFQNGLRELLDLDGVLRTLAAKPGFSQRLIRRAGTLGVVRPLYYGLLFSHRLLDTPLDDDSRRFMARARPAQPGRALVEAAMALSLLPLATDKPGIARRLADSLLLARAHWLRMPLPMLIGHLLTQVRRRGGFKTKEAAGRA